MDVCGVADVSTLRPADHICVWDTTRWPFRYSHHGIIVGSGRTAEDVRVAHVWSRSTGVRAAQRDSCFMETSLHEFLNSRPLRALRRVRYGASLLEDVAALPGEAHRGRADAPAVILARAAFLRGQGRGHFSLLSLNCEHVALWCTTGIMWSKQLMSRSAARSPFVAKPEALEPLDRQLAALRTRYQAENRRLQALEGRRVYLRLRPQVDPIQSQSQSRNQDEDRKDGWAPKYAKRFGDALYLVANDPQETDWAFRQRPTALRVDVHVEAYNCVRLSLADYERPSELLAATSHALRLARRRPLRPSRSFVFELGSHGELLSLRHRRWFVGIQTRDGLLRPVRSRDNAAAFELVDADEVDASSPWPVVSEPHGAAQSPASTLEASSSESEPETEDAVAPDVCVTACPV